MITLSLWSLTAVSCVLKEGQKSKSAVYDRHLTLTTFIHEYLGVDAEIAEKDACRIEHIISPETMAAIKAKMHTKNKI